MLDEQFADHLHSGLFHLEFAREMLLRTGSVRAFERHGWAWGDEAYTGMPASHLLEDNLNTLFQMTEPRLSAGVLALAYLNGPREEWWRAVLHPDGRRAGAVREVPVREDDFGYALIVSSSDAALLERYRSGLARRDPTLLILAHDPEPDPHPPSWMRRAFRPDPEPTSPNFLLLVDPWSGAVFDTIYRDVGKKKALVLAERYGAAYGLALSAYPEYLAPATHFRALVPEGSLVVGCVDNAATRRLPHERLSAYDDVVYVDAGNAAVELPEDGPLDRAERVRIRDSGWEGQVLCGVRRRGETVVPFPAEQIPDLLEDDGEVLPSEVPCGQVVVSNPQRLLTTEWAAVVLKSYLTDLLTDGTLLHRMSLFCARRGYVKSYPALSVMDEVAA